MKFSKIFFTILLVSFFIPFSFMVTPPGYAASMKEVYQHGVQLLHQGNYQGAIDAFEQVLAVHPDIVPAHHLLGVAYLEQNRDLGRAIRAFERAVEIDPHFTRAYVMLALIYSENYQNYEKAKPYFEKSIELDPNNYRAAFELAWIYLMVDENPYDALPLLEKVAELQPNFIQGQFTLGLAYIGTGKGALALKTVSKLRALNQEILAVELEQNIRKAEAGIPSADVSIGTGAF